MAAGDEIKGWLKQVREQPAAKCTKCPVCNWTLTVRPSDGVMHCKYCGWTDITVMQSMDS